MGIIRLSLLCFYIVIIIQTLQGWSDPNWLALVLVTLGLLGAVLSFCLGMKK